MQNTDFNVNVAPVLGVSTPTSIVLEIDPSTGELYTTDITVDTITNNATGYSLFMNASNTSLTNDIITPAATIPTIDTNYTAANFPSNAWGYSLDSGNNFHPITSTNTSINSTTSPNRHSYSTITMGTKVDYTTPAGTYTGIINFYATANVIPTTYTLTFDGNGGTNIPSPMSYASDNETYTFTIPDTIPTYKDHTFFGWTTEEVGDDVEVADRGYYDSERDMWASDWHLVHSDKKVYVPGENITVDKDSANTKLYAVYETELMYIDDVPYNVGPVVSYHESEMYSWEDWLESEHNTGGFRMIDGHVYTSDGKILIEPYGGYPIAPQEGAWTYGGDKVISVLDNFVLGTQKALIYSGILPSTAQLHAATDIEDMTYREFGSYYNPDSEWVYPMVDYYQFVDIIRVILEDPSMYYVVCDTDDDGCNAWNNFVTISTTPTRIDLTFRLMDQDLNIYKNIDLWIDL